MNISRRGLGSALLWAGLVVGTALNAHAASTSFQSPNTAAWGNWTRGTTGSLYVHWEEFDAYLKPGFPSALPDSKPDRGNFGAKSATVIPNNAVLASPAAVPAATSTASRTSTTSSLLSWRTTAWHPGR